MTQKKQLNPTLNSIRQCSGVQIMKYHYAAPVNDNIENSKAVRSIQNIIQSRIDVKHANLLEIYVMSFHLLEAGLINEGECLMLVNDYNIDKNKYQNFIALWMRRKKRLYHCSAAADEISKANEIISILRFVDVLM